MPLAKFMRFIVEIHNYSFKFKLIYYILCYRNTCPVFHCPVSTVQCPVSAVSISSKIHSVRKFLSLLSPIHRFYKKGVCSFRIDCTVTSEYSQCFSFMENIHKFNFPPVYSDSVGKCIAIHS